jgi:hypothetical protein
MTTPTTTPKFFVVRYNIRRVYFELAVDDTFRAPGKNSRRFDTEEEATAALVRHALANPNVTDKKYYVHQPGHPEYIRVYDPWFPTATKSPNNP